MPDAQTLPRHVQENRIQQAKRILALNGRQDRARDGGLSSQVKFFGSENGIKAPAEWIMGSGRWFKETEVLVAKVKISIVTVQAKGKWVGRLAGGVRGFGCG
ncbi:MAG: hypothetical protein ABSH48_19795 [Verrucomicrobiota bacterium]